MAKSEIRDNISYFPPSSLSLSFSYACVETRRSGSSGLSTGILQTILNGERQFIPAAELPAKTQNEMKVTFACDRLNNIDLTALNPSVSFLLETQTGQYSSGEPCNHRTAQVTGAQPNTSVCLGRGDRRFQIEFDWGVGLGVPFAPAEALQMTFESGQFSLRNTGTNRQDTTYVGAVNTCGDSDGSIVVSGVSDSEVGGTITVTDMASDTSRTRALDAGGPPLRDIYDCLKSDFLTVDRPEPVLRDGRLSRAED